MRGWLSWGRLRLLLAVVATAVLTAHVLVAPGGDATAHAAASDFVAVTVDTSPCHGNGGPAPGHESCDELSLDHCGATRSGPHTAAITANDAPRRAGAASAHQVALPQSVDRPLDRAHLQVWQR